MTDTLWWRSWGRLAWLDVNIRDAVLAYVRSDESLDLWAMESLYKNKDYARYSHRCADFDRLLAEAMDLLWGRVEEEEEIPF